jgi:intracellular sulfur oxidation DsrE/DsrF family protein
MNLSEIRNTAMKKHAYIPYLTVLLSVFLISYFSHASSFITMDEAMALETAPPGIVFEIVTGDNDGLKWALSAVKNNIRKLRERFKDLEIAVVTHGSEQFALTTDNQKNYQESHKVVQDLVSDKNVNLHVCGTFAGWRGKSEEDFPEYVDVSPAGPAQINDYRNLGYLVIVIDDN